MKKFIVKTIYFSLFLLPLIYIKPLLFIYFDSYQTKVKGSLIYHSIKKSKQKSKSKIILLGDSVGNQIFSNKETNDSINSLTSNQAIGVIGQYFILKNYLEAGNNPEIVYLIYAPFSFRNNLNQAYTFHYFLKPFYKKEYKNEFSTKVIEQINKIPFAKLSQEPFILTSNWSPDLANSEKKNDNLLSSISLEYLEKIKSLCYSNKIAFYIIATPTRKSKKVKINQFDINEYVGSEVENEIQFYLSNITYLKDAFFKDQVHLKKAKRYKKDILKLMKKARTHNQVEKNK